MIALADSFDAGEPPAPNVCRLRIRQPTVRTSNQNQSRYLLARKGKSDRSYLEIRTNCSDSSTKRPVKTTDESKKNYRSRNLHHGIGLPLQTDEPASPNRLYLHSGRYA